MVRKRFERRAEQAREQCKINERTIVDLGRSTLAGDLDEMNRTRTASQR